MSTRADFERNRITNEITNLQREYEQLRHSIMRTQRDEQFEIERIRREYKTRVNGMEARQEVITRDILAKQRDLERLEKRNQTAPDPRASVIRADKDRRLGRIR